MLQVNQDKYSAALQKFLGYNKEEADYVACDYNRKAALGQVEPLRCYPDPDELNNPLEYSKGISNKYLFEVYMEGWYDCSKYKKRQEKYSYSLNLYLVYDMGWNDYIIGDDLSSNDLQTREEIINRINIILSNGGGW